MRKRQRERIEKRVLADGSTKVYRYGPRFRTRPESQTVGAVIRIWQHSPEWASLRPKTVENYTRYIQPFHAAFETVPLPTVRRKHIIRVRDHVAETRGHGAAVAYCRAVSAFYAWCVDHDYLEQSPATRLRGSLQQGTNPTWTEAQAQTALDGLPEQYRRAVVLALHTGQRRGDLCALRWSAYDGERLRIRQEKSAGKIEVVLRVLPELKAELDRWRADARGETILETVRGRPWIPVYLSRTLPLELQKLGLPSGLNIHGLRKLAAVRLALAGCSTHEIAAVTGHQTLAMVQHYTRAVDQEMLAGRALDKLVVKGKK